MVTENKKTYFTKTGKVLFYGGVSLMLGAVGNFVHGFTYLDDFNDKVLVPYEKAVGDLSQLERKRSNLEMELLMPFDLGAPGGGMIREAYSEDIEKLKAVRYTTRRTELELRRLEEVPEIAAEIRNKDEGERKFYNSILSSGMLLISAVFSLCASSEKRYKKEIEDSKV